MMDMVPTRTLQEIQIELENMKQRAFSRGTDAALTEQTTTLHDHEEERKDSDREEGASSLLSGLGVHHDDRLMGRENVAMFHRDEKWKEGRRNACAKKMTGLTNAPSVRAEKRQRASNEDGGSDEVFTDGTEEEEEEGYTNVKEKKNARQQGRDEKKKKKKRSLHDDDDGDGDVVDQKKEGRKVLSRMPPLYLTKKDLLERRKRIQSLLDFTLANQQERQQT